MIISQFLFVILLTGQPLHVFVVPNYAECMARARAASQSPRVERVACIELLPQYET